jgi:hypothetical protein
VTSAKDYLMDEDDTERYAEIPFDENEWIVPKVLTFEFKDINKVLLVKSRNFTEPAFKSVIAPLQNAKIAFCFLSERWLPDKIESDTVRYFTRLENWENFIHVFLQNRL